MIGILLAAGFSRRFGETDKLLQALPDGRPLALAAAQNMISAMPLTIAVLRPDNETLAGLLAAAGLKIVFCDGQNTEMADSLSTAMRYVLQFEESGDGFVIALADMPFIQTHTITAVADAIKAGASIAAPVYLGQRGHPVGFAARHCHALAQLTGDEGARAILKRHPEEIRLIACNDAGILADIDTPADLAAGLLV